jgi:hypothetical protein
LEGPEQDNGQDYLFFVKRENRTLCTFHVSNLPWDALADRTWYRLPRALHTDIQFTSLFAFVRTEINRLRIPLLIINKAHHLDDRALKMLLLLRKLCNDQLGIVLVVRLQTDADVDEPLHEEFIRVPEAQDICRRMLVKQITEVEYKDNILGKLMEELNLDVVDDLFLQEYQVAEVF